MILPQVPVETFGTASPRQHALHPFFYWHLFTYVGEEVHRYDVKIDQCTPERPEPVYGLSTVLPPNMRYRLFHRMYYIGGLYELGDKELAMRSLRKVSDKYFARYRGCQFTLFWYKFQTPEERNFVEESRFVF